MPDQFWVLTPGELMDLAAAKMKREKAKEEREIERLAQLAAWLLQPYTKQPLTVDDFIKKPSNIKSKEDYKNDLADMEAEFGLSQEGG